MQDYYSIKVKKIKIRSQILKKMDSTLEVESIFL